MFFDKEYSFKGKHAKYVIELANAIFKRNVDILILAPVLGLIYNRTAYEDTSSEFISINTKIFAEQMVKEQEKILFNYRLCMLLEENTDNKTKIDNTFRYYNEVGNKEVFEKNIDRYNSYILGGVEILYELMIKENKDFNGNNANDIKYKKAIIDDVTEFISNYQKDVNDYTNIGDELDAIV